MYIYNTHSNYDQIIKRFIIINSSFCEYTRTLHVINKGCTRFGQTTRKKYYIILFYSHSYLRYFTYINLVFFSCLKISLCSLEYFIFCGVFFRFFFKVIITSLLQMNMNNVCIQSVTSDCCLAPTQQFFRYIMVRTS